MTSDLHLGDQKLTNGRSWYLNNYNPIGGGFKYFFLCSSLLGEDSHFG